MAQPRTGMWLALSDSRYFFPFLRTAYVAHKHIQHINGSKPSWDRHRMGEDSDLNSSPSPQSFSNSPTLGELINLWSQFLPLKSRQSLSLCPTQQALINTALLIGRTVAAALGVAFLLSKVGVTLLQEVGDYLTLEGSRHRHFVEKLFFFFNLKCFNLFQQLTYNVTLVSGIQQ